METMVADDVTRQIFMSYQASELILVCAWCARIRIDTSWHRVPRYALIAIDAQSTLSHGICPACHADL